VNCSAVKKGPRIGYGFGAVHLGKVAASRCAWALQLVVEVAEDGVDALIADVVVHPENADERCACLRYRSAHRPCSLAVLSSDFAQWQTAQECDDLAAARDLLVPVTLLWDQSLVLNAAGPLFHWRQSLPNGVVTRQLLERLRWAEQLDEVFINLEQLLLECELQQFSGHGLADQGAQLASAAGTHQTL
jgi:hypothetical protein